MSKDESKNNTVNSAKEYPAYLQYDLTQVAKLRRSRGFSFIPYAFLIFYLLLPENAFNFPNLYIFFAFSAFWLGMSIRDGLRVKASTEQKAINTSVFKKIEEEIGNKQETDKVMAKTIIDQIFSYQKSAEDNIFAIKEHLAKDLHWGKSDCAQGHHDYCAHRIDPQMKAWLDQSPITPS